MKKIPAILWIFATIAVSFGCMKEKSFEAEAGLCIESVSAGGILTRAVIDGSFFPESDAASGIGLFLTSSDGSPYDGLSEGYGNVKFYDDGRGWKSDNSIILSETQGMLYGYFPYSSSATDLKSIPVQSSLNGTDYMCAEPVSGVSASDRFVNLEMKHSLARLSIKFVKDNDYPGMGVLSRIVLAGPGIGREGTVDITDGTVTAEADTVVFDIPAEEGRITPSGLVEECLVVPVLDDDGQDVSLLFTIDGEEFSVKLEDVPVRRNTQTVIELSVRNIGLCVAGLKNGKWDESVTFNLPSGKQVNISISKEMEDNDVLVGGIRILDGSSMEVNMLSKSGKPMTLALSGKGCPCSVVQDEISHHYVVTLSGIEEDIFAEVAYDIKKLVRTDVPEISCHGKLFLNAGLGLDNFTRKLPAGVRNLYGGANDEYVNNKWDDVPGVEYIMMSAAGTLTEYDTLTLRNVLCGCEKDLNGSLIYPDGEPRFKTMYNFGGSSSKFEEFVTPACMDNVNRFYTNGGCYVSSCAGTYLAADYIKGNPNANGYRIFFGGGVSGSGMNLESEKYYTDLDIVPGTRFFELCGSKNLIDSLRHNGGPMVNLEKDPFPKTAEVLGTYGRTGGYPLSSFDVENTLSNPIACCGHVCLWTDKHSPATGRLVCCGSHPEVCNTAEVTKVFEAELQYASEGFGCATVKSNLMNGKPRVMDLHQGDPDHCGIGDEQYHHFAIYLPRAVSELQVNLDWNCQACLDLGLKYDSFAFADDITGDDQYVTSPRESYFIDPHQTIKAKNLSPGIWYISVHCLNKVKGVLQFKTIDGNRDAYWYDYEGVTTAAEEIDIAALNGIPYTITAEWTYK